MPNDMTLNQKHKRERAHRAQACRSASQALTSGSESPTTIAAVRLNEPSRYNCLCAKFCDRTGSCLAALLVG
jgi:hypothetical protein